MKSKNSKTEPPPFLPLSLAGKPHYIASVNRAVTTPKLDGKGDCKCWKNVPSLLYDNVDGNIKERSFVKLVWDNRNLYVFFWAQADNMEQRKKDSKESKGNIFNDDCFEIFIDPDYSMKKYYHLAGNSAGQMYEASGQFDFSWKSGWKSAVVKGDDFWSVEAAIPFDSFRLHPKAGDVWGFNACRENPVINELSAWRPLKSFQTPEMFGKIIFLDDEYLSISREEQMEKLYEGIYHGRRLLQQANANVKAVSCSRISQEHFGKICTKMNNQIVKCKNALKTSIKLEEFCKNSITAKELNANSLKLRSRVERENAFFSSGSPAILRGYEICVESPMTKISPETYSGSPVKMAELQLAGREYGSFQLIVLTKERCPLTGISLKMSTLMDANNKPLDKAQLNSFMVDYIMTAKPYQVPGKIADVLIPGKEFKFDQPLDVLVLWFDIYLPPDVPTGKYCATISLTPDGCQSLDIPVLVTALPFSLPLKANLPTAFCFVDYWAEGYYQEKMPQQKRYEYMQFILDHRLEPINLWCNDSLLDMSEDELTWAEERGKSMLFLKVERVKDSEQYYRELIKRFESRLNPVFFGYDEVLYCPSEISNMKADYALAKEQFPEVPRLNTSRVDEQLYGYVNLWCPLFNNYDPISAMQRQSKGEQVWWYPTDYPSQPYANFNLDSPGIDPRIIPWMNWKLDISGLLYWALNREWLTNFQEAERLTNNEKKERQLEWMTVKIQEKIKKGLRWPDVPWIPYFRSIMTNTASPSVTNGGGNLMYPGPDFQPLPSIRLKNLRDGLQDYEYFVILKNNVEQLKKNDGDKELIANAEKALSIDNNVVGGATSYTKDSEMLCRAKKNLADLIVQTQDALKK